MWHGMQTAWTYFHFYTLEPFELEDVDRKTSIKAHGMLRIILHGVKPGRFIPRLRKNSPGE
jgi:hypothetical protein